MLVVHSNEYYDICKKISDINRKIESYGKSINGLLDSIEVPLGNFGLPMSYLAISTLDPDSLEDISIDKGIIEVRCPDAKIGLDVPYFKISSYFETVGKIYEQKIRAEEMIEELKEERGHLEKELREVLKKENEESRRIKAENTLKKKSNKIKDFFSNLFDC